MIASRTFLIPLILVLASGCEERGHDSEVTTASMIGHISDNPNRLEDHPGFLSDIMNKLISSY